MSIKGTKTEQNLLKSFAGESQARSRYTFFASVAKKAAEGENEEWADLYPEFARIAQEEGFPQIANTFKQIAKVEAEHEARYRTLLGRVTEGKVFEREEEIEWQCRNCGYVIKGKKAPLKCPACEHPQAYFEPKKNNY